MAGFIIPIENDVNVYVENLSLEEDGSAINDAVMVAHFGEVLTPQPVVTDATNASPIVITAPGHGLANGNFVIVSRVRGNPAANGLWEVASVSGDTFQLVDSTGDGDFHGGGVLFPAVGGATGIELVPQGGMRYMGQLDQNNEMVAGQRYQCVIECSNYGLKLELTGLARVRS